jgi:hypothetical protein
MGILSFRTDVSYLTTLTKRIPSRYKTSKPLSAKNLLRRPAHATMYVYVLHHAIIDVKNQEHGTSHGSQQ